MQLMYLSAGWAKKKETRVWYHKRSIGAQFS
jgi:hypothetical protein